MYFSMLLLFFLFFVFLWMLLCTQSHASTYSIAGNPSAGTREHLFTVCLLILGTFMCTVDHGGADARSRRQVNTCGHKAERRPARPPAFATREKLWTRHMTPSMFDKRACARLTLDRHLIVGGTLVSCDCWRDATAREASADCSPVARSHLQVIGVPVRVLVLQMFTLLTNIWALF